VTERIRAGAAAGACLSALLAAAAYLGWRLAGLPFPPFDLFDWLARVLPGSLITLWIDIVVFVFRAVHIGSTAAAAKHAEQVMAIAVFITAGAATGAAAFAALRLSDEPATLFGGFLGGALGIGTVVVERSLDRIASGVHGDAVWLLATFFAWGIALGAVHDQLRACRVDGPGRAGSAARRAFLIRVAWTTGAASAIATVCGALVDRGRATLGARWSDTHALPNANAAVTPVPGTRAEFTPLEDHYRIDVDTRPPRIDAAAWRLQVIGLVDRPLSFSLDDIRGELAVDQFVTLACISNPIDGDLIGTTRWTGVSLAPVLARAIPRPEATHAKVISTDGFFEIVALATVLSDPRVMLAYAWDDVPLMVEHGFPLRLYVPDVYGMKQPKWIESVELVNRWEPGYWVQRGWDREGRMAATSVVDVATFDAKRGVIVAGGIAHAGARGVSRVEVRVDAGQWQDARLRTPLSQTTWVIWRAETEARGADFQGRRSSSVSVRCTDGDGRQQLAPFHSRIVRGGV
jgi:DMSO/TMAO reductase YedYZ molybdopterin-dependent catalytic subunit